METKEFIKELENAFEQRNMTRLKDISNKAIEKASMTSEKELVYISIIAYALYKLLSKIHFQETEKWGKFLEDVRKDLKESVRMSKEERDLKGILKKDVIRDIYEIDENYGNYARNIVDHIKVKQASRAYAMGLSFDKAASLTGADLFKLYSYIGTTNIPDMKHSVSKKAEKRYRETKKLFEKDEDE